MKVKGVIVHNGVEINIDETTMDQLIFQHKNHKTHVIITTIVDGKPLTFREHQIKELTIAQITTTDPNT